MKRKRSSGPALEKALTVLEAIIDQPQSVGPPDLADRLGMSRQTLHRLLKQLDEQGLVVKVPNRDRFAIGARLSTIALKAMCSANHGPPIRATVQEAVAEINESCNVGVLAGRDYVYIERVECDREPRVYLETGSCLPAHVTSGGKAMMAFLPGKARRRLVETMKLVPFTRHTITDRDTLLAELDLIRERGYATADQEYAEGIIGVGVPVLARERYPLAAIALHAPVPRIPMEDAKKYADRLQVAAGRLAEIWDVAD